MTRGATDARAEMLAAAESARLACQSTALAVQGFPGAVARQPRKGDTQVSLWDALELPPGAGRRSRSRSQKKLKVEPTGDGGDQSEPDSDVVGEVAAAATLIQAALRLPIRPWPALKNEDRNLLAHREVVEVDERSFVVRVQVGDSSIYSLFVDGRRSADHEAAIACIPRACPEASGGTSSRACILVNPDGPAADDANFIERWLLHQTDREALWRRRDPNAWSKRG